MKPTYLFIIILLLSSCQRRDIRQVEYEYLQKLYCEYKFKSEINYYFQQTKDVGMAATDYSYVSEHKSLIQSLVKSDTIKIISPEVLSEINKRHKQIDAKDYIVDMAKGHDFLMFNEAHYIPQHRSFLIDLLPQLSKIGYTNLALEGLGGFPEFENAIMKNGYTEIFHGAYPKEPEFGNMVRIAHELGFNIFGYDQDSGSQREITSAKNILQKINAFEKKGKTIVLCGWNHLKEGSSGNYWEYALAARIKEFSGKDPLTVNQTQYYERADKVFEDSLYQALSFKMPTVLIDAQNQSIDLESDKGWYDIFVFHPRTEYTDNVPNWMLTERVLKEFSIPQLEIDYPCKALIFEKDDDFQRATPLYIIELAAHQKSFKAPVFKNEKHKILFANAKTAFLSQ